MADLQVGLAGERAGLYECPNRTAERPTDARRREWQEHSGSAAHEIGDHTPCYVIAEIGHNHQGSLEKARELFREAKLAGAHAVKLQKRDNRGLYTRAAYNKPYDNENSFGATYGEHREFLEFGADEYTELQAYAARARASTSSRPRSTSRAPISSTSSTCRRSRSRRAT